MDTLETRWKQFSAKKTAYLAYAKPLEQKVHSFLSFRPEAATAGAGPLAGLPFAVKDNIAVKDFPLTCGSKMLESLNSPYTATGVARLEAAGATVIGKTNLDEFGMGSSNEQSAFGATHNPWDVSRVAGGSSGGSAAAVAAGLVPFALGTDTGGSVRQPASFCGVYGLKPTYGTVSRYGMTAYASSLEVMGIASKSLELTRKVYDLMKGRDEHDQTSLDPEPGNTRQVKTIAVLDGLTDLEPAVEKAYQATLKTLRDLGYTLLPVHLGTLDYAVAAYYTIATAEASANLARFNGIRYGLRPVYAENPEDLIRKSRTAGFGDEVKTRIMLGTYVLRSGFQDQYYTKAQKVRTAIRNELQTVFDRADLLLTPTFPTRAFAHGDKSMTPYQQKLADKFTVTANLTGVPALSFPAAVEDGLPVGMQFTAPAFEEARLFEAAARFATVVGVPDCPGTSLDWSK
ncbi:MAG: Asp-tRNA(Asn)/Glu-tRNA(Gln) amidotransferase subunit GatA [Spirochaetales bacterium]